MKIMARVGDIVAANVHELVDHLEDPVKLLKHALRELETAIDEATAAVARTVAAERLIARQEAEYREQAAARLAEAEQAVAAGDDLRARTALVAKRRHTRLAESLAGQRAPLAGLVARLRGEVADMQAKHAEGRRRLVTLTARQRVAEARLRLTASMPRYSGETAWRKFERLEARIDELEAEAEAFAELAGASGHGVGTASPNHDEWNVEAELLAIKSRSSV